MNKRLRALKNQLKSGHVDGFLVTNPTNVYYLSGLRAEDPVLLITTDASYLITDFRFKQEASTIQDFKLVLTQGGFRNTFDTVLKGVNVKKLGFEADSIPYSRVISLKKMLRSMKIASIPLSGVVESLRLCKDDLEIRKIKNCILVAKKAFQAIKKKIKPGITEKRISIEMDHLIRDLGAERNAFPTIVASGRNSSRPHALATERPVAKTDAVLVDFGATIHEYNCDLTRVSFLGKIRGLIAAIYDICKEASRRAIDIIRPGIMAGDVDKAARGYIESKGYGEVFGHSLGHGVGLYVHELPHVSAKSREVLKPGMVFTVEPGIYLEKVGGVRVEDMVLVTKKGCEVLTDDIPK